VNETINRMEKWHGNFIFGRFASFESPCNACISSIESIACDSLPNINAINAIGKKIERSKNRLFGLHYILHVSLYLLKLLTYLCFLFPPLKIHPVIFVTSIHIQGKPIDTHQMDVRASNTFGSIIYRIDTAV